MSSNTCSDISHAMHRLTRDWYFRRVARWILYPVNSETAGI